MCYLGDGVFWEVLVGEVTGLDQLAGDLGVWRVKGLPMGACNQSYGVQTTASHSHEMHVPQCSSMCYLRHAAGVLYVILKQFCSSILKGFWKSCQQHAKLRRVELKQ